MPAWPMHSTAAMYKKRELQSDSGGNTQKDKQASTFVEWAAAVSFRKFPGQTTQQAASSELATVILLKPIHTHSYRELSFYCECVRGTKSQYLSRGKEVQFDAGFGFKCS